MSKAKNGRRSSSAMSMSTYAQVEQMCGGAPPLTPLLIVNQDPMSSAWRVAVANVCKNGYIPRTYISYPRLGMTTTDTLLKLRDILEPTNVSYSVISESPDRILVCVRSLRVTIGSRVERHGSQITLTDT